MHVLSISADLYYTNLSAMLSRLAAEPAAQPGAGQPADVHISACAAGVLLVVKRLLHQRANFMAE
jgi:hypothetical protein